MNRFQEPKDWDNNVFRIWGTYKPEIPLALIPQNACDCFVDLDDLNNAAFWPEYEIELLKGGEPEITKVRLYSFDMKKCERVEHVNAPGLELLAEDYLRDDHSRWNALKQWLEEYGERELVKEREAA